MEIKDVIESVEAYNQLTFEKRTFTNSDCEYGYRNSYFKNEHHDPHIITYITLRLSKNPGFSVNYGNLKEELTKYPEVTLETIREAVITIRRQKLPDPEVLGNAGSFFMNPIITAEHFEKLKKQFPEIPSYPASEGKIKVPAGRYKALCINSDTEALLYRNIGEYHTFELYSPEGSMNTAAYSVLHPDRMREERIRCSPDNFYADRIEEALLEVTEEEQTIVFYPANPVCHYTVEVRNVSNLKYVSPGFVTGALSGMSEGLFLGRNRIKSEPATIPFEMSSDGVSTLYADFLTFGQYESQNIHKIVIQVVMPDGNDKGYLFDVTDQVHQAPDPRNVHIILDGLPLPKPIVNGGGFLPSVDEWDNIEVDLPMK